MKKTRLSGINIIQIIKNNWDKIVLTLLIFTYIAILGNLSVLRHNAFVSNFDLSNMDQTLWFTLNGHFFSLRLPEDITSRFAVHADLLLVLLSPLYLIKDDVRLLLWSQTVALGLGAIPTYLLSLKILKSRLISLAIVTSYLLNPAMQWTNIYDFHAVSFAIPFLISAFYFAYIKRWAWFGIFAFLAILTKEQISLNVAVMGIFIFFFLKSRLIGIATFCVGIAWFFLMVFVVMPHFSPNNAHWVLYSQGPTDPGSILNKYLDANLLYNQFVQAESLHFYRLLLEPFGFIPIVGFQFLLLSAPEIFIAIMIDARHINLHYDSGITPAIVIATIFGFSYIQKLTNLIIDKKRANFILFGVAGIMLLFSLKNNYYYSPLPTTPSCWCMVYDVTDEDKAFEKALQEIPKDAVVTSSLEIKPHITHRYYAYGVPSATESADFIALITQNRIVGNYEDKDYENKLIPILLESKEHSVRFQSKYFYLFERIK